MKKIFQGLRIIIAHHQRLLQRSALTIVIGLVGCTAPGKPQVPTAPPVDPPVTAKPVTKEPAPPSATAPGAVDTSEALFRAVSWSELPGWSEDNVGEAWNALLASCNALRARMHWRETCALAAGLRNPSNPVVRRFLEQHFVPYEISSADGSKEGLITGYYEPLLRGSQKPSPRYRHAVYGVPDDLVAVDLAEVYPELKSMRLRGRLEGRRLVPYPDRAQIEAGHAALRGKEIAWVDDEIDLFFLHIQGSGRILLESGETIRVGYADQNGRPYRSIGRVLVERGELRLEQASMQGIKAWARNRPHALSELLNTNPSYVFFRALPASGDGPPGALGVPLTAGRSIAVDRRYVPLGAPVYVSTTWPNSTRRLNRLMLAQDTGGAIRGPLRADFFWGFGEAAGTQAGQMKQRVRMWVLLPRNHPTPDQGG